MYYLQDGVKKVGIWEDGKRISWVENDSGENIKPKDWDKYEFKNKDDVLEIMKEYNQRNKITR